MSTGFKTLEELPRNVIFTVLKKQQTPLNAFGCYTTRSDPGLMGDVCTGKREIDMKNILLSVMMFCVVGVSPVSLHAAECKELDDQTCTETRGCFLSTAIGCYGVPG